VLQNRDELKNNIDFLPAVHKLAMGGYDGKGVQIIKKQEDIPLGFDAPAVLEKMISIEKEIAIIVAVAENGKTAIYPPVEMFFDPILNLLDLQLCPASIPEKTLWKAEAIALTVARKLDSPGIFAIEMFVDKEGTLWVNETAPRVHNSGHHTIEAHYSSQFDMLWRIIMNYPLGNTTMIMSSMMVNLLGAEGYAGKTHYEGLEDILSIPDVFVHLYGKTDTKPGRKMGHVTIISNEKQELIHQANRIKSTLRIKGNKTI
jgi:5-(carboxyamino)imidazole ribonucleotide synthase